MDFGYALAGDVLHVFYGAADPFPKAIESSHHIFGFGLSGQGGGTVDELK